MEFFQFICSNSILVKIKETLNSSFSPFTTFTTSFLVLCIIFFLFFLSLLIYLFIFFWSIQSSLTGT